MDNNLIFDLGFCDGTDTTFYLEKGFKVVAVEGNPSLAEIGSRRFKDEIDSGQLILLNRVVAEGVSKMDFYIHPEKIEWSSIYKHIAEQDEKESIMVSVDSISIFELFKTFDTPHYMKVDIEGCDVLTSFHLSQAKEKPKFVSFELNRKDYLSLFYNLHKAGYTEFQLINQANNKPLSSGKFGQLLPENNWISLEEALFRYCKFNELRALDYDNLSFGWLDLHARR